MSHGSNVVIKQHLDSYGDDHTAYYDDIDFYSFTLFSHTDLIHNLCLFMPFDTLLCEANSNGEAK